MKKTLLIGGKQLSIMNTDTIDTGEELTHVGALTLTGKPLSIFLWDENKQSPSSFSITFLLSAHIFCSLFLFDTTVDPTALV